MEEVLAILERIAVAFEEQNRLNAEWTEQQRQWREEGDPLGQRIIALHEQQIEEQRVALENMTRSQHDYLVKVSEAFFESLLGNWRESNGAG